MPPNRRRDDRTDMVLAERTVTITTDERDRTVVVVTTETYKKDDTDAIVAMLNRIAARISALSNNLTT